MAFHLQLVLLLLLPFFLATVVRSELPPWVYDEYIENAENYVSVKVIANNFNNKKPGSRKQCNRVDYNVRAKILEVFRSNSIPQIQVGDVVDISTWYLNYASKGCQGFAGPGSPDWLYVNWCGNAYLNASDGSDSYTLAAEGQSFEKKACPKTGKKKKKDQRCRNSKGGTQSNNCRGNLVCEKVKASDKFPRCRRCRKEGRKCGRNKPSCCEGLKCKKNNVGIGKVCSE